ncbi:hypothetical protein [Halalkalibaculum sp. DA384]|uniref:hypothetical protein n=1 Tax=Halalkalibaculum sp. DA384 TaxID=3373606 RepID=UPI003754D764
MQDASSSNNESGRSKKVWLRVLIVVAVGIPVLIELSTLFNLLKVQFWGAEEPAEAQVQTTESAKEYVEGDTLFVGADSLYALHLKEMRVDVSPASWEFSLILSASTSAEAEKYQVELDSLLLRSGQVLAGRGVLEWSSLREGEVSEVTERWEVPNGDIPDRLFLRVSQRSDSAGTEEHLSLNLGPIPVRYDQ